MSTIPGSTTSSHERPRFPTPGWWVRDRDGQVALAQVPNPALSTWLVCAVVTRLGILDDRHTAALTLLGQGALAAWAVDELVRGSSPARRVIGAVVLPVVVWRALS